MAPFHFTGWWQVLVTIAIGFAFGFVLERSGFGNARNLAAQFYLHDMRVLKVMFTAIVTAMVLIFLSSAVGLLDFTRVYVPPTYLGPAVVGGLLLGVGFIVGGYCPGTSLVSAATGKVDGLLFVLGVAGGLAVFGLAVPSFWEFWNFSGAWGRWTLDQFLGVDAGIVVLGVVAMAVAAFACAELAERMFARDAGDRSPSPRARILRRAAVVSALGLAAAAAVVGQPTVARRVAWQEQALQAKLRARSVHIDPAELLAAMENNQIALVMLDVRAESDYQLFHLRDAVRVTLDKLEQGWAERVSPDAVVVVMSNDERGAEEAWKRLAVSPHVNAYVLAGGINRWLDLYRDNRANVPYPDHPAEGRDELRHDFAQALGQRAAASRPDATHGPLREYTAKVQLRKVVRAPGGGCG